MTWTAIGLGSNIGDRREHLRQAVERLSALGRIVAVSPLFATAAVGGPPQADYLNAVAVLDTALSPRALLGELLDIEAGAGRSREVRWGPRTIDLDLLLYDDAEIDEPGLQVPHPRMTARRFVLFPLLTVWPRPALPDGTSLAAVAAAVAHQDLVAVSRGWDSATRDWRDPATIESP